MDVHRLKVFVSVYKNLSFSRASEELHLSQPTISEHIKSLEDHLGVRLFDRMGRTTAPTPEAGSIYPLAVEIIEKLENIKLALASPGGEPFGDVLIGASTIPGTYIIPRAAASFRAEHPSVAFTIEIGDSAQVARRVADNELPAGIVGAKMFERGLAYVPFVEEELVVVMKKGLYPKTDIRPEDLKSIPFLMREEGSGTRKSFEKQLRELGVNTGALNIVASLGSSAAILEAVRAGLGASVLSSLAVDDDISKGRLVELRLPGKRMKREFHIVTRKGRTLPTSYGAFFEHLAQSYTTK